MLSCYEEQDQFMRQSKVGGGAVGDLRKTISTNHRGGNTMIETTMAKGSIVIGKNALGDHSYHAGSSRKDGKRQRN